MKNDTLKTIGAIIVIGLIIVATFLYGNKQRQDQLRHNQQISQDNNGGAKTSTDTKPATTDTNSTNQAPAGATAPVQKPTQTVTPAPAATPATSATPDTGPGNVYGVVGLSLAVGLYAIYRGQKSRLRAAFVALVS